MWSQYVVLAVVAATSVAAFQVFPGLLPNGGEVKCPDSFSAPRAAAECPEGKCVALGHINCLGGRFKALNGNHLNQFGNDFLDARAQWTLELCERDSDGDGVTNGQELGDPCCLWTTGNPSPVDTSTYKLSHPGNAEDATNTTLPTQQECDMLRAESGQAHSGNQTAHIDNLFQAGEDRVLWQIKAKEHSLRPDELVYAKVYYPIAHDRAYYMVGAVARIDNRLRTHQLVLHLCSEELSVYSDRPAGEVQYPVNKTSNGMIDPTCIDIQAVWVPGFDVFRLPHDTHMWLGRGHFAKTLMLEIQYNNKGASQDERDASGYDMYLTTQPREHEAGFMFTGSIVDAALRPAGERIWSSTQCVLHVKPECSGANVIGYTPHGHFQTSNMFSELYRPKDIAGATDLVGDVGRAQGWPAVSEHVHWMGKPIHVQNGDIIATTCIYSDKPVPDAAWRMCINFLLIWPMHCVENPVCQGMSAAGALASTISAASHNLHAAEFEAIGSVPDFGALIAEGLVSCNRRAAFSGPGFSGSAELWSELESACGQFIRQSPERLAGRVCNPPCRAYIENLWTCLFTGEVQPEETLDELDFPATWYTPPSCMLAITQELEPQLAERTEQRAAGCKPAVHASTWMLVLGIAVLCLDMQR